MARVTDDLRYISASLLVDGFQCSLCACKRDFCNIEDTDDTNCGCCCHQRTYDNVPGCCEDITDWDSSDEEVVEILCNMNKVTHCKLK